MVAPKPTDLAGFVLAVIGMAGAVLAAFWTISLKLAQHGSGATTQGTARIITVLVASACAAAVAVLLGTVRVVRAEKSHRRPRGMSRLTGALGTICLGLCAGLSLALWVLRSGAQAGTVKHSPHMQPMAYVILGLMLAALVVGVTWCFYRALTRNGSPGPDRPEPQDDATVE